MPAAGVNLIATGVPVLHLALQHDAACFKASMRMIGEASRCLVSRQPQLIQHEKWVQVAQASSAHCPANLHACPLHHLLALNHLHGPVAIM